MITRDELTQFCNDFLRIREVPDSWCENGLQVPGKQEIQKIALGTSASKNFLQMAADWQADAVILHHGLFWKKGVRTIDSLLAERLRIVMKNDISLLSYHLPLDGHPEIGNNIMIAKNLGLSDIRMVDICAVGRLPAERSFAEIKRHTEMIFEQDTNFAEAFRGKFVQTIGICSGGGASYAEMCKNEGADTFITGEISEYDYHNFKEMELNFIASGHHATERFGIQAVGEILRDKYPTLEILFFSEPCPV